MSGLYSVDIIFVLQVKTRSMKWKKDTKRWNGSRFSATYEKRFKLYDHMPFLYILSKNFALYSIDEWKGRGAYSCCAQHLKKAGWPQGVWVGVGKAIAVYQLKIVPLIENKRSLDR